MTERDWIYTARVARVVDADTLDLEIDLGFGISTSQRIRLVGPGGVWFDAWEVRGPDREKGLAASQFVESAVRAAGGIVTIRTHMETGKFGRYLAEVKLPPDEECSHEWDLAEELWNGGHAKRIGEERR